ncbi:hypothetical protein MPER_11764 [Moniliophthora perniciosa FA553]|nr:hypothetical protein MPER_11764 [Moniliophthora perniciosa FA553]
MTRVRGRNENALSTSNVVLIAVFLPTAAASAKKQIGRYTNVTVNCYTYALSYLDHGFIRYISSIHLDLRKQGLQRLVASNTNPDAVLAITFNYSVYPTQVLVDLVNGKPEKIECCLQHIQWQAEERFWGQQLGIKVNLRVLFPGKNHDGLGGEGLTIHGEDPPP